MHNIANHNINPFIGACIDPGNICVCWTYAGKGSLEDVIWNETIHLDDNFAFSFCRDILKVIPDNFAPSRMLIPNDGLNY